MIKLFSGLEDFYPGKEKNVSVFDHWPETVGVNPRQNRVQEVVREVIKPDFVWVFPGSFCPPTYGHERLVERAADIFPKLRVICSDDPGKKERWFTMAECGELWRGYGISARRNVAFQTLDEFMSEKVRPEKIAIIRGIRNGSDWEREKQVAILNQKKFGITRYFYLLSEDGYEDVSSSRVRAMAENFEIKTLHRFVSPLVVSALLEKVLKIENLILVVGKPGAGKSTFLRMIEEADSGNVWINSDKITRRLKTRLEKKYPGQNLVKIVRERGEEVSEVIGQPWLEYLKQELKAAAGKRNVFVEIPYGLEKDKQIFRFVGGKVLFLGCGNREGKRRNIDRGTPELLEFFEKIPGKSESLRIAKESKLSFLAIDTGGSLEKLREEVQFLNYQLKQEGGWKNAASS